MTLDEIKELIALMRKHRISEIDLEQEGSKIRIVAEAARQSAAALATSQPMPAPYYMPSPLEAPRASAPAEPPPPTARESVRSDEEATRVPPISPTVIEVKSPMVGTFYRAPAPDAPSYVEVGSVIHKDSVLCIIEAMKLMNEIKGDASGRIVQILVSNGQPVEYNQPLFLVEP